jgi:hypothetical protein
VFPEGDSEVAFQGVVAARRSHRNALGGRSASAIREGGGSKRGSQGSRTSRVAVARLPARKAIPRTVSEMVALRVAFAGAESGICPMRLRSQGLGFARYGPVRTP